MRPSAVGLWVALAGCTGGPTHAWCEVQADGPHTVYACPFTWTWSDEAGTSVGPLASIELPTDLVSFAAYTVADGAYTGIAELWVDDELWIDAADWGEAVPAWYTAPFFHDAWVGGAVVAPMDRSTDPAGAYALDVAAAALDDLSGEPAELRVILRAGGGPSVLDLRVAVVGATEVYEDELQAALAVVDRVWASGSGPQVGEVEVYALPGDALLDYADADALRRSPFGDGVGVNVFLIADFLGEDAGTLGEAGGIPGVMGATGVDGAGVIAAMDPHLRGNGALDVDLFGSTLAHEIGHQLGLFHTTEADGTRTEVLDTPACPPSADTDGDGWFYADECEAWDGRNFMFWIAGDFPQEQASPDQGFVLARSPAARPR